MWKIFKSEISYLKTYFILGVILVPVFFFLQTGFEDLGNLPILAIIFLLIQNWLGRRTKEKREYKTYLLPVSSYAIAFSRVIMIIASAVVFILIYQLILVFLNYEPFRYNISLTLTLGIMLFIYSIYFILRDLLLYYFRRIGLTANRMILILSMMGIILNMLGIYVFIITKSEGKAPEVIGVIIEGFKKYNPFFIENGSEFFLLFSFFLAGLSLISYQRRAAYLD